MELPVIDFIREIVSEANPDFETRKGTAFYDMFVSPQQLMLQPLINTLDQVLVSQSVRKILQQPSPDDYNTEDVNGVVSNVYVTRDPGAYVMGPVRVYYATPLDKEFTALAAEFTSGTLSFFNISDISITASQMSLQTEGELYYMDVEVQSQLPGAGYSVAAGAISAFVNDTDAVRVTNLQAMSTGKDAETNTQLLIRAQNSIGVRDLETVKGINAILTTNYNFISALQPIGMGDPEMQRDIVFNTHVGGKTDVYIKTPSLTTASLNVIGLDYDLTRKIDRQIHVQMATSMFDQNFSPDTGTPQIVPGTVIVKEDVVETAARVQTVSIPASTGINCVGAEWIKLQIDGGTPKLIRIAGAIPAQTQQFEIINSINATLGYTVAAANAGNTVLISSQLVGALSSIVILPVGGSYHEGAGVLFGISPSSLPLTYSGVAAEVYSQDIDYTVNYVDGLIAQKDPYSSRGLPTILSNQEMISNASDGKFVQSGANIYFMSTVGHKFYSVPAPGIKVRVGDTVTINSIGGLTSGTPIGNLPQTFNVSSIVGGDITVAFPQLVLSGLVATGSFPILSVNYSITSNQVVIAEYQYNPISVDIGGQVLLADGVTRGVRPGRDLFTIKNTPFIDIVSIVEIDPQSGEVIGTPLNPPEGFGYGGYGAGGYGQGLGGDYDFRVLAPKERYSVFDGAVILFGISSLTLSYQITYRWVPELVAVHQLTRNDSERVTGADVLARSYVPCFVDIPIGIVRDPTNITTPTDAELAVLVKNYVNGRSGLLGVLASDIIKLLEAQGLSRVSTPFTMTGTLLNTDGTTQIYQSADILKIPDIVLPSDTTAYATKNIVFFFPGNITIVEVV